MTHHSKWKLRALAAFAIADLVLMARLISRDGTEISTADGAAAAGNKAA